MTYTPHLQQGFDAPDHVILSDLKTRLNAATKSSEISDEMDSLYEKLACDQDIVLPRTVHNAIQKVENSLSADPTSTDVLYRTRKIFYKLLERKLYSF